MSLSDRLADWKNRLIASPAFQQFAVSNPLTRGIASRKASESFDLVAGFVYSQILAASVETELIRRVSAAPLTVEEFAGASGITIEGAERLLRSATALKLLRRRSDGRFALGEMGAALLGNPSVFSMVRHHQALYRDLGHVTELLHSRTPETELGRFWAYGASARAEEAATYSHLMAETQALVAAEVIRVARLKNARCLMDVGGGVGAFVERAGQRYSDLALRLVDLPQVALHARQKMASNGLADRVEIYPLDFLSEPLPQGADLITLIRVLHDHDDAPALQILRHIRAALPPSGRLLLAEPMADAKGASRMGDAYFGMYLWAMGRGRPRRFEEIEQMLRLAGFRKVSRRPTRAPLLISAIEAQ